MINCLDTYVRTTEANDSFSHKPTWPDCFLIANAEKHLNDTLPTTYYLFLINYDLHKSITCFHHFFLLSLTVIRLIVGDNSNLNVKRQINI